MTYRRRLSGVARWALAILGIGSMLAAPVVSARAQGSAAADIIVDKVDLVEADLQAAVQLLIKQTGAEIVFEPADKPYGKVTLTLDRKPLKRALEIICTAAGAQLREEGGIFFIGPKRASAPPPAVEPAPAPEPVRPLGRTRTEKIQLRFRSASEMMSLIDGSSSGLLKLMNALQSMDLPGMGAGLRDLNHMRQPLATFVNNNHQPIAATTAVAERGTQGIVPNGLPGDQNSVAPLVPAPGGGQGSAEAKQFGGGIGGGRGGFGGGIGGIGGIGGGRGGFGGGGLGGLGGGGLGGLGGGGLGGGGGIGGQGALGNIAPNTTKIGYDVDNTIIVIGPEDEIDDLRRIIKLLDVAPKQLMIKAEFITVSQNDLRSFGVDWQLSRGSLVASTGNTFATGDVAVQFTSGNVVSALRTSLVEGKGRVVNSPMVTTENNIPVTISVSTTVPIITTGVAFGGGTGGQGITIPQINIVDIPTSLFVIPRINGDDTISMSVLTQVQEIVSQIPNPAGGTIPIVSSAIVPVQRRIRNGETMVIGGLVKKNDRQSVKKVPVLADLPLIGQFFQSRNNEINDSELLVFVTPMILPDPGIGAEAGGVAGTGIRP